MTEKEKAAAREYLTGLVAEIAELKDYDFRRFNVDWSPCLDSKSVTLMIGSKIVVICVSNPLEAK